MKKTICKMFAVTLILFTVLSCEKKIDAGQFIKDNANKGEGIVMLAVQSKNIRLLSDVLNTELAKTEGTDFLSRGGITPLMWAARTGNFKQVELLIANGADPLLISREDFSPLEYACLSGNKDCILAMIKAGSDINRRNKGDMTALVTAVCQDDYKTVKLLVQNGADVNLKDSNGDTPLMYAVYNNSYNSAEVLIGAGAAPGEANNDGVTPLMNADKKMKKIFAK